MFSKSVDCGDTGSTPSKLSEGVAKNQGTTIAVDPGTGNLHLAWREFASPGDTNSRNDITVADTTPPSVVLSGDAAVTIEASAAYVEADASATDLVSGALATTASGTVNTLVPGSYTIIYSATEAAGKTASASRVVVVADRAAPVFGSTVNVVAEATSPAGALVTYAIPSATDTIDAGVAITCAQPPGLLFPLGISTVSCTATDDSGNGATTRFTVTVRDTVAPVLTVPANITGITATSAAGFGRS